VPPRQPPRQTPSNKFLMNPNNIIIVILMPNKFRKRNIERKGTKKEQEKDRKLLDKNVTGLTDMKELEKEYEAETAPIEEGEVESRIIGTK